MTHLRPLSVDPHSSNQRLLAWWCVCGGGGLVIIADELLLGTDTYFLGEAFIVKEFGHVINEHRYLTTVGH